jgi:virginiamycin B lyase
MCNRNRLILFTLLASAGLLAVPAITPLPAAAPKPAPAASTAPAAQVTEFPLHWPKGTTGSTHELAYNRSAPAGTEPVFWVTGQLHDALARVTLKGTPTFFALPTGSGPHGIVFDAAGRLWVTLEFSGQIAEIDQTTGKILRTIDVQLHAAGAAPINTHPHGLGLAPDGITLWFTGKATGTVGRVDPRLPDGGVRHFALPTVGSVPIYIVPGPDGAMWCTELVGNQIARIAPDGGITEYPIPTFNSRPIAITPGPDGRAMWFSEEAGNQIGRLDLATGKIAEFPLPRLRANTILAALAFDRDGHLWTQAYIDPHNDMPAGPDAIVKLDRAILTAPVDGPIGELSSVPVTYYEVPTADTVMHRITQGPDGAIWFTELAADQLGRLDFTTPPKSGTATVKNRAQPGPRPIRRKPEFCSG